MAKNLVISGIHSVEEILESDNIIKRIYIDKKNNRVNIRKIITLANIKNIPIKYVSKDYISDLTGDKNNQGIAAEVIYENKKDNAKNNNLILLLDHITDVHNLGAILRSAEFFDVSKVVIPVDRSADITPTVFKISEGAVSNLRIEKVKNLKREIDKLKKDGYWIIGADVYGTKNIYEFEFPEKCVIVVGNENKGISRLIKDNLDFKVFIPRKGKVESLNVSVATAIFLSFYRYKYKM